MFVRRAVMTRWARVIVAGGLALGALFGSVVFAEWLGTGTGTGTAKAGSVASLQATGGTPIELLHPGGSGDVAITITNPNPFPMVVTVVADGGIITSDTAGCGAEVHSVAFTTQVGAWPIAADDSSEVLLADAAAMGISAPDECQDATFTIPVSLQAGAGSGTGDEEFPYYTGPNGTKDVGECRGGTIDGEGNVITAEVTPQPEVPSDGLDNDCDGVTDEAS